MKLKTIVNQIVGLGGYTLHKLSKESADYDQDGLWSIHNHEFMSDPGFRRAYERGIVANGGDFKWDWRVHVGLWAASSAAKLEGDFVECGVNRGFLSSSIMTYLNWNELHKTFYLMDTFKGIDERYITHKESQNEILSRNVDDMYVKTPETVKNNFSEWENVKIIVGPIPETLEQASAEKVAYLHIDMNCAPPEVAAFNYFWEKLVPGAFVLLDDYAYKGYESQKEAMDNAASLKNVSILSLPTGQGLIIKPCLV